MRDECQENRSFLLTWMRPVPFQLETCSLVSRSINTVTFVASATASSSRSDDDAMSVTSWRRSDKEIDAVALATLRADGGCGQSRGTRLRVTRRRRCPCITFFSLLNLPSQAPSANVMGIHGTRHYYTLAKQACAHNNESDNQQRFTLIIKPCRPI